MDYDISELEELKCELVERIRKYSRSQKEDWRKVPMLALEAEGRTGYSDNRSRAYMQGFWALEESVKDGYYRAYIDLETGDIVKASSEPETTPVTDLGKEFVDYVGENQPLDAGELKSEVEERVNYNESRVHRKFVSMLHDDLKLRSDKKIELSEQEITPASDEVVLMLANDLDALDASKIVETLEDKAEEPVGDYYDYDEKELERRHRKKAELLGLEERYSR